MCFGKLVYEFVQLAVCLVFADFDHLIAKIVFCRYEGGHYMSFVYCYYASSPHHSYLVAPLIVAFVSCPFIIPCVHDLPSSCCSVTIDPVGRKEIFSWASVSLFYWDFPFVRTVWLLSSLLHAISGLLDLSSRLHDGLLNSSVVGLNIYMSALVSKHFFMILVTKLMCVSAYQLLSWLYDDDTVLCVLSLLQSSQTSLKYIL